MKYFCGAFTWFLSLMCIAFIVRYPDDKYGFIICATLASMLHTFYLQKDDEDFMEL